MLDREKLIENILVLRDALYRRPIDQKIDMLTKEIEGDCTALRTEIFSACPQIEDYPLPEDFPGSDHLEVVADHMVNITAFISSFARTTDWQKEYTASRGEPLNEIPRLCQSVLEIKFLARWARNKLL